MGADAFGLITTNLNHSGVVAELFRWSIAVPDAMLWLTVLGGVLIAAALGLATAVIIRYLFFRNRS